MKDINYVKDVIRECETMAIEAGIPVGIISSVKINTRAQHRWGLCRMLADGTFEIEISYKLLQDNVEEEALMNTAMHEVLHTVDGCMNHGKEWKRCAEIINRIYGLNIKRCTSSEEKMITEPEDSYNYIVKCPKCGYEWKYIRMSKCVRNPQRFSHNGCGVSLIRTL